MSGFFKRLFQIGSSEANTMLDGLEDPVKMTEQGIRDLKKDLEGALQGFAEVKAIEVRSKRDMEKNKQEAADWERKAMALLQQGQDGGMELATAERLATESLTRKETCTKSYLQAQQNYAT